MEPDVNPSNNTPVTPAAPTGGGGKKRQFFRDKFAWVWRGSPKLQLLIVAVGFAVIGTAVIVLTHAATASVSVVPKKDYSVSNLQGENGSKTVSKALYTLIDDGTSFAAADNANTYVFLPSGKSKGTLTEGFNSTVTNAVTQVVANYRARNSNTTKGTAQILLFDGTKQVATGPVHTVAGSFANYSDTFSNLSVSSIAGLRAQIVLRNSASKGTVRLTQLWLNATYNVNTATVPTVAITAPANGSTVANTVNITGTSSDPEGISKVEVQIDGGSWQAATGTTSWSYSWDASSAAGGSHTIAVRATDTTGTAGQASETVLISPIAGGVADKLGCTGPTVTLTGTTTTRYGNPTPANSTFFDMTGWESDAVTGPGNSEALSLGTQVAPNGMCILGGVVKGSIDPNLGWMYVHDSIGGHGYRAYGKGPILLDYIRVHNVEDGFKPRECDATYATCPTFTNTGSFKMTHAYMTGIRDDSIEDDEFMPGTISDSLFDGVWTFFSEQLQASTSASAVTIGPSESTTINIDHVYVRLYTTNSAESGPGKWFKYQGAVPHHTPVISDSVFAVDKQPRLGWSNLDIPAGTVWKGTNNYILWLGTVGGYGGPKPAGVTFLEGQAALDKWNQVRNDWLSTHGYAIKAASDLNPMDDPVVAPKF
jgi:hypothetical protein